VNCTSGNKSARGRPGKPPPVPTSMMFIGLLDWDCCDVVSKMNGRSATLGRMCLWYMTETVQSFRDTRLRRWFQSNTCSVRRRSDLWVVSMSSAVVSRMPFCW